MTVYARGSARERKVMLLLEGQGFVVYRSAGSHGCADLVALRLDTIPALIQVKADAQSPWAHFGPVERRNLLLEARAAGGRAVLCWWPPGGRPSFRIGPNWDAEVEV
jgi:Holliday junction resolvase